MLDYADHWLENIVEEILQRRAGVRRGVLRYYQFDITSY